MSDESDRLPDASCDKSRSLTSRTSRARADGTGGRTSRAAGRTRRTTRLAESEESHVSGPIRRDASSDESNFVGATGGDPRVGRVDESNTQPPRRSLVSGPVGATRRTTAERVESTVELCRSDKSTGRYDSKTRVGPRRVASGRAWTWLMSRARGDCERVRQEASRREAPRHKDQGGLPRARRQRGDGAAVCAVPREGDAQAERCRVP